MSLSFHNLSPADFEDLARDLIGEELGVRFEAFGPGADNGIDGRHSSSGARDTILQAKHLEGSTFATLIGAMRRERSTVDKLAPARYLLVTSQKLTPDKKQKIRVALGKHVRKNKDKRQG